MVRTERWRVLLAATLLGVVLRTGVASAAPVQTGPTSSTTTTVAATTTTGPGGSTTTTVPTGSTSSTTTTTVAAAEVPSPTVTGPVSATVGTKGHPLAAAIDDLARSGYQEQELFLQGTATAYEQGGTWGSDGRWTVNPAGSVPYRTRILVRRPIDPTKFDGTVIVSWLNVNGAFEMDPEWAQAGAELMREGAAFVGVSSQMLGVDGPLGARRWDAGRYGSLDLSGDSLSYDVFSQAAQAIRSPKGIDPLAGLSKTRQLLASGQSQSAQRLVTYIDAFQPMTHLFDGFLLVSRFPGAAPLGRTLLPAQGVLDPDGNDASHPFLPDPVVALLSGPVEAQIRSDTDVPVFVVLTETEARQDTIVRRPDSNLFRTWEVAGASHVDATTTAATVAQLRRDFPSVPLGQLTSCAQPNTFPMRYALRAAVQALSTWVDHGTPPAVAPPLARDAHTGALLRDADGNAIGGLRLPQIDVPTSRYTGTSEAQGYCGLAGSTVPLSPAALAQRYPTTQSYVDAVTAATTAAVQAGHLLPADAAEIDAAARGGATEAVIASTAAAAAASGASTTKAASSRSTASGATTSGASSVSAAAAARPTSADHGWLATTGRDLFTPVLIGILLILNGRVVLTIAHQRRRGGRF